MMGKKNRRIEILEDRHHFDLLEITRYQENRTRFLDQIDDLEAHVEDLEHRLKCISNLTAWESSTVLPTITRSDFEPIMLALLDLIEGLPA